MAPSPRILVLRGGAIGDFIVTLPALHALRTQWPHAYIELIGYPHIAELARAGGLVDRVGSLDRAHMARLFGENLNLGHELKASVSTFDFVLTYLHDPSGLVQENLKRAGARQVLYGPPSGALRPMVEHLLQPLETLALYVDQPLPSLTLAPACQTFGQVWREQLPASRPIAALHPGSGSPRKNWPLDRFLALADALRQSGWTPFFLVGEADEEIGRALQRLAPPFPIHQGEVLLDTASILSACDLFVGNDSGITHLAAALGIRTVALFGPTDARIWGPRGRAVTILEGAGGRMEALELADVVRAARG